MGALEFVASMAAVTIVASVAITCFVVSRGKVEMEWVAISHVLSAIAGVFLLLIVVRDARFWLIVPMWTALLGMLITVRLAVRRTARDWLLRKADRNRTDR